MKNIDNNINYKHTTIGLIPFDWEIKRLKQLGKFSKGKGILKEDLSEKGLPCIRYGEIYTTHEYIIKEFKSFISKEIAKNSQPIYSGDILFAGSGETIEEIGKAVAYIGNELAYAGGDIVILSINKADNIAEYISYALESSWSKKQKRRIGQGYQVVHIYPRDLATIQIPIPPYSEQKIISEILSLWDKAINVTQKAIESNKYRRQILANNLLLGKIRIPGFQKRSGFNVSELGLKVPKDWPLMTVNTIFDERNERSNDQNVYPLFSLTIENGITEKTERYERSFLLKDKDDNQYKIVYPNDILINPMNLRFGAIAKSNLDFSVSVSAYYNAIKLKDKFNNAMYFENLFKTNAFINLYEKIAIGSLIEKKRVHLSNFFKLQVPFPSPAEQDAISKILLTMDAEIQLLKKRNNLLMIQKRLLMQQLLTGKKRVKVN